MFDGLDSQLRAALALVGLGVLGGGCGGTHAAQGGDPHAAPDASADASSLVIDVGTGLTSFQPVADGDPVPVIAGPQGGFHIWTSVRVHDATIDAVQISLNVHFEDTGAAAGKPSAWNATLDAPTADGMRTHDGMTNFVTDPSSVHGKRVVLHAEVDAPDGRHGAADRTVVPE